ncbi:MAG TPA: heparan-alpha-glucosaminide N-acetyltransferase domain-containing protein [Gemmatimonadaceae bacterium]
MKAPADGTNLLGESLSGRSRLYSVDMLRGLVMVIMALDHVRDFFSNAYAFDPTDLTQTNAALFFTRWITHFCAPVFVFLAGTGAFLSISRGKTKKELAGFLLSRGLWLVFLDLFFVHTFGWWFNFDYHLLYGDVLWALGWSMVAMAGLVFLPVWSIAAVGIAMVALHNLFDAVRADSFGSFRWLWAILHSGDILEPRPGFHFVPGYPLVPWIGVMAAGYGFGTLLLRPQHERRKWLLGLGVGLTVAFIVIRATNLYGDPHAWATQKTGLFTFLSFINPEKYPPSLIYLLMTLGPAIIALALFERISHPLSRPFVIFGRVPLFYYLLHLVFIHALAIAFAYARYGQADWMFKNVTVPTSSVLPYPQGYGYGLVTVYAIWLGVVLILYPACRWFASVKRRRREAWLSYL